MSQAEKQAAFKLLWEELVRGGMDPNQAAAEALKRFRQQSTTNAEVSNNTKSVPTILLLLLFLFEFDYLLLVHRQEQLKY